MILVEIMQVSCSCCYYMWHFVEPRFANAPTASPSSSMTTAHAKPCIHAVSLPILHMHLLVLLVVAGTPECVQAALVMPWGNSLTCPTSPSASHTCSKVRTHLDQPTSLTSLTTLTSLLGTSRARLTCLTTPPALRTCSKMRTDSTDQTALCRGGHSDQRC
jgi:hypothetical protein